MLKKESVHCCRGAKYKTYCLFDDPWVIRRRRRRFTIFVPEAMKLVEPLNPSKFVNKLDWRFLLFHILEKVIARNFDKSSEYYLKSFPNVLRRLRYPVTLWQQLRGDLQIFKMEFENASKQNELNVKCRYRRMGVEGHQHSTRGNLQKEIQSHRVCRKR